VSSIFDALRKRFAHPEWAYFEEVRNGTGFSRRTTRTADGLAFSTWPSRGLELHGIEVKVSRGDWLREKGDPEKAEEIARFCDRWWLAVTPKVLDVAEVPPAWGLIEWDGKRWRTHRDASKRQDVQPLDRLMLAAILRKASESDQKRLTEWATRLAADMHRNEVELAKSQAKDAHDRREHVEQQNRRLRHLLNRVLGYVDGRLDLLYAVPDELPPEVVARLEAARNLDLEQARREAQWALGQLRAAAVTARQALRRAGVRPPPRGPRVPVLP